VTLRTFFSGSHDVALIEIVVSIISVVLG